MVQSEILDYFVLSDMKFGYARISSSNQDLELQKQALEKAGCRKIFAEAVSGKNNNREQLLKMLLDLREGVFSNKRIKSCAAA